MDLTAVGVLLPVVLGVIEAIKAAGLPSRWAGLASVGVGIVVAALFAVGTGADIGPMIWAGIIAALSASGLYSGGKAIIRGEQSR